MRCPVKFLAAKFNNADRNIRLLLKDSDGKEGYYDEWKVLQKVFLKSPLV